MLALTHYEFHMQDLEMKWQDVSWVAFDLETTGKYPLEAEICEIAAVKWQHGEIVGHYQQLIKPSCLMSAEVIAIHNITNEMVQDSPSIIEALIHFSQFIDDSFLIAHHAPFDIGFLAIEYEKQKLPLPVRPVFCSSLLSRKIFPQFINHKLQTLINHLQLPKGQAHRALDDASACLRVALKCFEQLGPEANLQEILKKQGSDLYWSAFSINALAVEKRWQAIFESIEKKQEVFITYKGGSNPGKERKLKPLGVVRSPRGDFLVAITAGEAHTKRYLLDKIANSRPLV